MIHGGIPEGLPHPILPQARSGSISLRKKEIYLLFLPALGPKLDRALLIRIRHDD
jgi:hypothetical protein